MALEIKIPAVGESITEVTIAKWLKKDGEAVKRDEVIAELESDKASSSYPPKPRYPENPRGRRRNIGIGTVIAELGGAGAAACSRRGRQPRPPLGGDALAKGEENPAASDQAGYGGQPADAPPADPATPGARPLRRPAAGRRGCGRNENPRRG